MEEGVFSLRTSIFRSPPSSPLRRDVWLRPEDNQLRCCPRAVSCTRASKCKALSSHLALRGSVVHAPVQAPSKHTYLCTLYQLRSRLQNVLSATESSAFFYLFYLVLVSKTVARTLMFKFWFISLYSF